MIEYDYVTETGETIEGFFISTPAYISIFSRAQKYESIENELKQKDALFALMLKEQESLRQEAAHMKFMFDVEQVKRESVERQLKLYKTGFWASVGAGVLIILIDSISERVRAN